MKKPITWPPTLESLAEDHREQARKIRETKPCFPINTSDEDRAAHMAKLEEGAQAHDRAAEIILHQVECEA